MAVFTLQGAKENIRVKDGKRVFYLADGDHLTPSAEDWLRSQSIAVLPATQAKVTVYKTLDGGFYDQKPEHMTHLLADTLVRKDHPRIKFRGMIDELEAEILLAAHGADGTLEAQLTEVLEAVRQLIRCDVMSEPVRVDQFGGLTLAEIRIQSQLPHKYYDQPHFMPSPKDSPMLLALNKVRTAVRRTELAAYEAFHDENGCVTRNDILQLLNRLSSFIWILMIQLKKEQSHGNQT